MMKKIILGVLCILVLVFILGNSLLPPDVSGKFSSAVGEFLASFLGEGDAYQTVGGLSVRKMGHFVEFFAFGVVMIWLSKVWFKKTYFVYSFVAFIGLLIPVIDETLQIFSDRGSALTDVWIDVCGYVVGVALACTVIFLLKNLKCRVKNNNKK